MEIFVAKMIESEHKKNIKRKGKMSCKKNRWWKCFKSGMMAMDITHSKLETWTFMP
jgi:hypothetical protein